MRLLVDTHALIWAVDDPTKLGPQATLAINDSANELLISAASIWELSIKVRLGKLTLSLPFREWMNRAIADLGAALLPITVEFAEAQSQLPGHHGGPFDRMIIAQAQVEDLTVVSSDAVFAQYGVARLW